MVESIVLLNFDLGSLGFQFAETTAQIMVIVTEPARNAFVIAFGWRIFSRHVMEREHPTVVCIMLFRLPYRF